jgi:hypothetical protein
VYLYDINGNQECESLTMNTKNREECIMSNNEKQGSHDESVTKPDVPVPDKPDDSSETRVFLDHVDVEKNNNNKIINEVQNK